MRTTVKAFQGVAVVVDPAAGEALMLTVVHPGQHVEGRYTAFLSDEAAEVLVFALEMALLARQSKRKALAHAANTATAGTDPVSLVTYARQPITLDERAQLVAL